VPNSALGMMPESQFWFDRPMEAPRVLQRRSVSEIQVVIADTQPLTLSGLRTAVADEDDITILAECENPDRLFDTVRSHSPDVLVVSGEFLKEELDALEQLTSELEGVRVIILTSRNDTGFLEGALRCGAKGVFHREWPIQQIPKAIRKVTSGGIWLEHTVAERVLEGLLSKRKTTNHEESKITALTPREREVIDLVCQGLRNKELSDRLHISEATVSHHLTSVYRKLDLTDRTSLVIYAVRQRLVIL
jgi:two-component system, NarL family, response regulator DegU